MTLHEQILESFNSYIAESESFEDKGVKVAGTRARKALGDLTNSQRQDVQKYKIRKIMDNASNEYTD